MSLELLLPINLVRLELRDSMIRDTLFRNSMIEDASLLGALGALAHLKRVSLSNAYVGAELSCMAGSFPQLEELNVKNLPFLATWTIKKGAMPCLKKLEISRCWCLKKFPEGLPLVTTLERLEFFDVPNAFIRQAAKYGWAPLKRRLPHNFASIIKHSDSPVDSSSIQKLYEQLIIGILLDNKTMKYWVTEKDDGYINSFMVYVRGLYVYSGYLSEVRLGTRDIKQQWKITEVCPSVEIKEGIESLEDGTMVTVVKIKSLKSSRYTHVIGKFDLGSLSLEVKYEIHWIIMFEEPEHAENSKKPAGRIFVDEDDCATTIKTRLNGKEIYEEVTHDNSGKLLNEWIRFPGGEINTHHPTMEGQIELALSYEEGKNPLDLVIQGFIIRPKL